MTLGTWRAMQSPSRIPRPALVLGWLGVVPFVALAGAAIVGGAVPPATAVTALVLYAAIILSFMGGVQWGLAMAATSQSAEMRSARMVASVMPALAAFALWLLPTTLALSGLAVVYAGLLVYDLGSVRAGVAPPWYAPLRLQLTAAVVIALVSVAAFRSV